jgi:LPXTG-motif cell wall-anchored protein
MFRSLLIFGLASSLMAVCQTPSGVTVNGGYVAPAMPGPPVLTPPNAALPGDGPATGAPPDMSVNDARTGGAGSVFEPAGGTLTGSTLPQTPGATGATGANASSDNGTAKSFGTGMGTFSTAPARQSNMSLADIARKYKAERAAKHPREFDNSSIRHASYGTADTNLADMPQSDQASATYGSTGSASVPQGVLNAGDYASVQAALARSQAAANVNATDNTVASAMPDPNRAAYEAQDSSAVQQQAPASTNAQQNATPATNSEATTPQVDNQADANQVPAKKQLPASGSELPLFALLGLVALAVGGIFTVRARRSAVRF